MLPGESQELRSVVGAKPIFPNAIFVSGQNYETKNVGELPMAEGDAEWVSVTPQSSHRINRQSDVTVSP